MFGLFPISTHAPKEVGLVKKLRKKDAYFLEMLNAESKYRATTGGKDCDKPFITPILFSLLDTLNLCLYAICFLGGSIFTLLLVRL